MVRYVWLSGGEECIAQDTPKPKAFGLQRPAAVWRIQITDLWYL